MARRSIVEDDWDGDWDDETGDGSDDDCFISCPYCKRSIHEDSERCPYCENYLSEEDAPSKAKPLWLILAAIVCLLIVVVWIMLDAGW
jgi:predicted nucleic acid-binding Zn ribbon protein